MIIHATLKYYADMILQSGWKDSGSVNNVTDAQMRISFSVFSSHLL